MMKRMKQAAALVLACVMALGLLPGCGMSKEQQGALDIILDGTVSQDDEEEAAGSEDTGDDSSGNSAAVTDKWAQAMAQYATDTIGTFMLSLAHTSSAVSVPSYALAILQKYPDDASENAELLTRASMEGIAAELANYIEKYCASSPSGGEMSAPVTKSFDSFWVLTEAEFSDLILALDTETAWKDQLNTRIFNGALKAAVSSKIDDGAVKAAFANASLSLPDAAGVAGSNYKVEYLGTGMWVLWLNFTLSSVLVRGSFG